MHDIKPTNLECLTQHFRDLKNSYTYLTKYLLAVAILIISHQSAAQQYELKKATSLYEIPALKTVGYVSDVVEDQYGYAWLSTSDGIYKYDGYELTHYVFNPNKPNDIAGNWISNLIFDKNGDLWFGVFGIGLQKFNQRTGKFTLYRQNTADQDALPNSKIEGIAYGNDCIWMSTQIGVCRFSLITGKFKRYDNSRNCEILYENGTAWFLSKNTLSKFDEKNDTLIKVYEFETDQSYSSLVFDDKKIFVIGSHTIYSYLPESNTSKLLNLKGDYDIGGAVFDHNRLLISTSNGNLLSYNSATETVEQNNLNLNQPLDKIFRLKSGEIWVTGETVFKMIDDNRGIETFQFLANQKPPFNINSPLIPGVEDGKVSIGVSVDLDFNSQMAIAAKVKSPELDIFDQCYEFSTNYTMNYRDKDGNIFIAFLKRSVDFRVSLYRYDEKSKKLVFLSQTDNSNGAIFGITKFGNDLCIATWRGLLKYNIATQKWSLTKAGLSSSTLTSSELRYVFKDRDDGLWIASQTGLNYKKRNEEHFTRFLYDPKNKNSISFDGISSVTQDSSGLIWIATMGGGVNSYDIKTKKFTWFTANDGLSNNNILNILVDNQEQIWVTTDYGISRINPKTKSIQNFTSSEGASPPYFENCATKMPDGSLIFAGSKNFTRVWPEKIGLNDDIPNIHITNFKLHNDDVIINGNDGLLQENINTTTSLTLKYDQNVISFQYAAIDMRFASYRNYAYKLEGFDKDWQYVGKKREATFTNLPPGDYTLKIKTAISDGKWMEMKTPLQITILPPWWKNWWAYTIYTILILTVGWAFVQYRSRSLKAENIKLESKVIDRTNELQESLLELRETQAQLIQSEKMASLGELTAGIAHEIQNPLNFVNNFSEVSNEMIVEIEDERAKAIGERDEELVSEILSDIKQNLEKINQHGKRADAIVKGMLQHSRSSSGQKQPTDINALVDEYLRLSYHGLRAKNKDFNATMHTDFDNSIGKIAVVTQDVGRVILNLFNNAFYAVNEKKQKLLNVGESTESNLKDYQPTISVSTKQVGNEIQIRVSDNGNGIPQSAIDKIFQPFFTTKPTGEGTGLGLSMSYDIIKAHGGKIEVKSKEGVGTEFIIELPATQKTKK